jgi:hypothetical protein
LSPAPTFVPTRQKRKDVAMNEFDQRANEPLESWYDRVNKMDPRTMSQADSMRRAQTLVQITALKIAARKRRRR